MQGGRASNPMKVSATGGPTSATGPRPARGAGGEGFRIEAFTPAGPPASAGAVSTAGAVMGVGALLALQEVGSPLERRRRSVWRASSLLDELEGLKIALLGGSFGRVDLDRLTRVVREQRDATEDPKLEMLLDEIETRALVELAKLERATGENDGRVKPS
jgi:Class II flagellar assembly regulator